jgi:hypothetical protein
VNRKELRMLYDRLFGWDELPGKRVSSLYRKQSYGERYVSHIWVETFERGYLELVISKTPDGYYARLALALNANEKNGIFLNEVSTVTFDKYAEFRPSAAIACILIDLHEQFGGARQDFIYRARQFWGWWYDVW